MRSSKTTIRWEITTILTTCAREPLCTVNTSRAVPSAQFTLGSSNQDIRSRLFLKVQMHIYPRITKLKNMAAAYLRQGPAMPPRCSHVAHFCLLKQKKHLCYVIKLTQSTVDRFFLFNSSLRQKLLQIQMRPP